MSRKEELIAIARGEDADAADVARHDLFNEFGITLGDTPMTETKKQNQ